MRDQGLARVLAVVAIMLVPAAAWAQSSITGTVRDASGGVLPGVTVEAASPVLIEGVRSAVTDAQGIYKVVDLRPGTYTLTFSLPGFRTVKRDEFVLPAEFAATVNAELGVGAVNETVTVTGDAPVVDIKSSRAQTQFEKSTIEALPGAGRLTVLSDLVPGATLTQEFNRGVGGTSDRTQTRYSVHGGPEAQPYVDGVNQQLPNSTQGVFVQPAEHPGGRGQNQRRRRRSRQRRHADQHDPEGRRQPVLGHCARRLFGPEAGREEHHARAAGAASRSQSRRVAEEVPRHGGGDWRADQKRQRVVLC